MGTVVLPNTITDDTPAEATEVQGNDEALRDGVNNIDRTQIAAGEIHAGLLEDGAVVAAKIGTGAVTNTKLGADAVTNAKILDATIEAAKLAASIQVLVHKQWEVTVADGATETNDFAGLDTTITPHTTVYKESGIPNRWLAMDSAVAAATITATCYFTGGNWRVDLYNNTGVGGSLDFMVAVSGKAV